MVTVGAVHPATFPLVGSDRLSRPPGAHISNVLGEKGDGVVPSSLYDALHAPRLDAPMRVLVTTGSLSAVRLAGTAPADDATWTGNTLTVSTATW